MPPDTEKFRVAFAGCHRQLTPEPGGHNWAAGFCRVPETHAVAVYDRKREVREQFRACWRETWGEIAPYDDYQRMLDEVQPDIVCIATHQSTHADEIVAAVRSGVRGIVCDKQLTTTLKEADRALGALRECKVPFAFGTELRWSEQYRRLFRLLREGAVGEVTAVLACGVTELINHGCHWYDMALGLAGDAEPVWASGLVDDPSEWRDDQWQKGDPHGRGWVGLENGVNLAIVREGGRRSFTVLGMKGHLLILNEAAQAYLWKTEPATGQLTVEPHPIDLPVSTEPWQRGPAIVRDLIKAIRTGGRTLCDVEETRRVTEIGFALHASNDLGGARVSIPVENRTIRINGRPWGIEDEWLGR